MQRRQHSRLRQAFSFATAPIIGIVGGLFIGLRLIDSDENPPASKGVPAAETVLSERDRLEAGYDLEDLRDEAEGKVMQPRLLTKGERHLVKSIFGDAVEASGIEKRVRSKEDPRRADSGIVAQAEVRYLDVDDIFFYGGDGWSPNYAREGNVEKFDTFVHEMTHIWQNQTDRAFTNGQPKLTSENQGEIYHYSLCEGARFSDYPAEEQASIMADYTCLFIHPARRAPQNCENMSAETNKLLKKVVEDMFPAARKTRQELHRARQTAVASATPPKNVVR